MIRLHNSLLLSVLAVIFLTAEAQRPSVKICEKYLITNLKSEIQYPRRLQLLVNNLDREDGMNFPEVWTCAGWGCCMNAIPERNPRDLYFYRLLG